MKRIESLERDLAQETQLLTEHLLQPLQWESVVQATDWQFPLLQTCLFPQSELELQESSAAPVVSGMISLVSGVLIVGSGSVALFFVSWNGPTFAFMVVLPDSLFERSSIYTSIS